MKTTQELNSTRLLRHLLRTDFFNAQDRANRGGIKAPKCNDDNKLCGKACIPPEKTCRISQAQVDEIVGEIEDQIRDRPVEYMAIVDSSNGELIGSNKGQRTTVDYPPGGVQAIRSRPPGTVIITHNHPNVLNGPPGSEAWKGLTFSNNDLVAASQLRLKEMRAVSNGYSHSVKPSNDRGRWPDGATIDATYQKNLDSAYREVLKDVQSGKTNLYDADAELQHRAMQRTTSDLGLIYTRTPVRRKRRDSIDPDILRRVAQKRLDKGIECGDGWISSNYVCRKSGSQVSQSAISALGQSAKAFVDPRTKQRNNLIGGIAVAGTVGLVLGANYIAQKNLERKDWAEDEAGGTESSFPGRENSNTWGTNTNYFGQTVAEQVEDFEAEYRDAPIEHLLVIRSDTAQVIASGSGDATSCGPSPTGLANMQMAPPRTLIITHNHPNTAFGAEEGEPLKRGVSFSDADLITSAAYNVKEIRAVSNGYTHTIKPFGDNSWPHPYSIQEAYQRHMAEASRDLLGKVATYQISMDRANREVCHEAVMRLAQEFDLDYRREPVPTRQRKTDSLRIDAEVMQKNALKRHIEKQARSILSKIYKGKVITRLEAEQIQSNGSVYGLFWDKENNQFSFAITKGQVLYKLLKPGRRDSLVFVEDKRTGSRKPGVKCGDGWISADYVCRKAGAQAPQKEIAALNQSAQKFAQLNAPDPGDVNEGIKPAEKVNREELEGQTIRELKKVAKEAGVVNYGSMPKETLVNAIVVAKENPEQQARIRKTLERKRDVRREAKTLGKGIPLAKAIDDWNKFNKLIEAAGIAAPWTGAAIAAFVTQKSKEELDAAKQRYAETLGEAARDAETRAKGVPSEATDKDNIMFVVGGFKGEGSSAEKLRQSLSDGNDDRDKWFEEKNHVVEFDLKGVDIPEFVGKRKNANGEQTLEYNAHVAVNATKNFVENYAQGHSEDAVELASQFYAYYNHKVVEPGKNGKTTYPNQGKRINVLAHSAGGNVVNEALDILKQMSSTDGGVTGSTVLQNVNVIALGTPSFGFSEDLSKKPREIGGVRTISPKRDPISRIAPRNPTYTNQVKGREIDDFMKSDFVREQMRRAFGYYRG